MTSEEEVEIEKTGKVYPDNYMEKKMISVDDIIIDTTQARRGEWEDDERDRQLIGSVEEIGLIYDIIVRPTDSIKYGGKTDKPYACVAGSRRLNAMISAGNTKVSCIVKDVSDIEAVEISISENIGRKDLTPFQEQRAVNLWYDMKIEKKINEVKELNQDTEKFFEFNKKNVDDKDKTIVNLIQDNPIIEQKEIAEYLNVSGGTISLHIKKLKKLGILRDYPFNIEISIKEEIARKLYGGAQHVQKVNDALRMGNISPKTQILLKGYHERTPEELEYLKSQGIDEHFVMGKQSFLILSKIEKEYLGEFSESEKNQKIFEMIKKGKIDEKKEDKWQAYYLENIKDELAKGKSFEVVMEELENPFQREFIFEEGTQRYNIKIPAEYVVWHNKACAEFKKSSSETISYIYLLWLEKQAKDKDW